MKPDFSPLLLLPLLVIAHQILQATSACPWDNPALQKWSNPKSWPSGQKPKENDTVVIPEGKQILLDEPIPRLLTLTIDGTLVWGNVDGIRLETSYVAVNGQFHIGSEDCNFQKTADICLYGKSNSKQTLPNHSTKFILAAAGSNLEIHGKNKKSWTKLVATIPSSRNLPGIKFDSQKENVLKRLGIWMGVWSADGTTISFETFDLKGHRAIRSMASIVKKINELEDGQITALAVHGGIGTREPLTEDLLMAFESLGASQIRNVKHGEPYVLIAAKGNKKTRTNPVPHPVRPSAPEAPDGRRRKQRSQRNPPASPCSKFNPKGGEPSGAVEKYTKRQNGVTSEMMTSAIFVHGNLAYNAESVSAITKPRGQAVFRVMTKDAACPKLSFLHNVSSWETGDEVVVASTDFDWRQAEVKVVVECDDCKANQIRVEGGFRYSHFGEVTYGVDERGEVGLLSRNIRIEAELQDACYAFTEKEDLLCKIFERDTFGGHVKVLKDAVAHIEGVQLTHMGQQSILASYPLHFHLADAVPGQYLRNNVIRDSNSRCITIHGTDYLEVSNNVCLNHLGHGIFLEDSAEQNNTIHRNLVIGTQHGSLIFSDMEPDNPLCTGNCRLLSSFWITHPNNYITENVAAGSDMMGLSFTFGDRPLGPAFERMKARGLYREESTRHIKVPKFSKNVMHSNKKIGLWFDNRIAYEGQNGYSENSIFGFNFYAPREPPTPDGVLVETVLSETTLYKNAHRNTWVRCGNVVFANSTFADSETSYIAGHVIEHTKCVVRDSIFIGETDNKGEPYTYIFGDDKFSKMPKSKRPRHEFDRSFPRHDVDVMVNGVQFYTGPMMIESCYFDQYRNTYYNDSLTQTLGYRPMRRAAPITFAMNNHYAMDARNGVRDIKYGFCDGQNDAFHVMDGNISTPGWTLFDGMLNPIIRDYDGSLTSYENASVVQDRPFFTGPKCLSKKDWGLSICPYRYFRLVIRGPDGLLTIISIRKTPILLSRDDVPDDVYAQRGDNYHRFLVRANKSYTIWFNPEAGPSPRTIQFRPREGFLGYMTLRVAVCLPRSTTNFTIYSTFPYIHPDRGLFPTWVNSVAEVDNDPYLKSFYWDRRNGYLYFKMGTPPHPDRFGRRTCPNCQDVRVIRNDGGVEPAVCTAKVLPAKFQEDHIPQVKEPPCRKDSPKGLGASIEKGFHPPAK